ncbi:hypothetical protein H0A43_08940 [Arcobacter lanthieri]|uniref:hypothetical protein n=1 Tax=Aliarcobacter lanthieri TaxID=1355374 RepID=UPI001924D5BD|nr:hypothetical protein [Aliarcobacter lanthieri]MBL3520603.1 hypothetical protein [Aliarcobacter lanthieri]
MHVFGVATPYSQFEAFGAKAFTFSDTNIGTGDSTWYETRANGFNIRCIKN